MTKLRVAVLGVFLAAVMLVSKPPPREAVGADGNGGFLLNSGWRLQPAGKQIGLDTLPMSTVMSPDGRYMLVLHGGYKTPSIVVIDTIENKTVGYYALTDAWLGLAISPQGDRVWASGGSRAAVYEFSFSAGTLVPTRTIQIVAASSRTSDDFIGDVAVSADGAKLYVAKLRRNQIAEVTISTGTVLRTWTTARRPYRILPHAASGTVFVSGWSESVVARHSASNGALQSKLEVGAHPADMAVTGNRLFVASANTNFVYAVDIAAWRLSEAISVALAPRQPVGMTPSGLALSGDAKRLYVACSDANAVAVVDLTGAESRVAGFVPTGWYPTHVRALTDGRLAVLNGRGLGSYANKRSEYVAYIQTGTASMIDPFDAKTLDGYTATVLASSPYRDELMDAVAVPEGGPIPARVGDKSPIKHVIYIVKENRTYDQVLGDMKEGNGDPSLVMFGEEVSPNHHKLAREFVLFDNFYVNADVSAEGHNWSTGAIANDYVVRLWPNNYAGRGYPYDFEGSDQMAIPPANYLWTRAAYAELGISNYGHYVNNLSKATADGKQISSVRDPILAGNTNVYYRGFDLEYPDVERARVFLSELAGFEQAGWYPNLIVVRLGNDHTSGATAGKLAPQSMVADNDYALGQIVEGVSRSRFWKETAIFVLEDDAQNGPDHVDSHRSPVFVISPYTKRGVVDSTMYNTTSVLRTIELILGLQPMTHFDAAARPMAAAFQATPDVRPYLAEKPRIALDKRNGASANSARSARMDFSEADRIDDDEMNDILWRAIKGTTPPPPVRSRFPARRLR